MIRSQPLLRRMQLEDYDAVYALWQNSAGMGLNSYDDSRQGVARYLERNPGTCFVAVREGAVIGAILSGHDGRRGYIYHMAVAVPERGNGVATALLDRALLALEREGIRKAALVAFRENADGNAFWEQSGFAERQDLVYRNRALDAPAE